MQTCTQRTLFIAAFLAIALSLIFGTITCKAEENDVEPTHCKMIFNLSGWSMLYETASGTGNITCDNGQSSLVNLQVKGGGITAGKYTLSGKGDFSSVWDIDELFGSYAAAEAHAGVVKSADAQVVTKGSVSLALVAKGRGINLGFAFSNFSIEPLKLKEGQRIYHKEANP